MDVKEAVGRAKTYVADLLAEEDVKDVGLEEIEYNDADHVWNVTVGFSRPWNIPRTPAFAIRELGAFARDYRVVRIRDRDGEVISLKKRDGID